MDRSRPRRPISSSIASGVSGHPNISAATCGTTAVWLRRGRTSNGTRPDQNLKPMNPEIARNQNYDDHHANNSENVHSPLLPFMVIARSGLAQRHSVVGGSVRRKLASTVIVI